MTCKAACGQCCFQHKCKLTMLHNASSDWMSIKLKNTYQSEMLKVYQLEHVFEVYFHHYRMYEVGCIGETR